MLTCPSDHTGKTQKMLVTKCQLVLDMSSYFFYFYFYFYFILFYFYFFFHFFYPNMEYRSGVLVHVSCKSSQCWAAVRPTV